MWMLEDKSMSKMKILGTVVTVSVILLVGCGGCQNQAEDQPKEQLVPPANIIVLLDLSDRVSVKKIGTQAEAQAKADIETCEKIVDAFDEIISESQGKYTASKSRLRFLIPDQIGFPIESEIKEKLKEFGKTPIGSVKKFDDTKKDFLKEIGDLYKQVLPATRAKFTGSDIWSWFKDDAKRYIDLKYRNYIICLSDGYLDFDTHIQDARPEGTYIKICDEIRKLYEIEKRVPDESILKSPSGVNFSKFKYPVKFLMIGIKDRTSGGSFYDKDILKVCWEKDFLKGMSIVPVDFIPSDVSKEFIKNFMTMNETQP